jgi:hypothetical protein
MAPEPLDWFRAICRPVGFRGDAEGKLEGEVVSPLPICGVCGAAKLPGGFVGVGALAVGV